MRARTVFVLLGTILLAGCTKPNPWKLADTSSLPESSSRPKIRRILDMGSYGVPCCGTVERRQGDGVAVVGETLLIRGSSFGRGPSVSIGGVPTEVLARTEDGAILVRVPPGTPEGPAPVVVANEAGSSTVKVMVRRFAAVGVPMTSTVHVIDASTGSRVMDVKVAPFGARAVFHPHLPYLYVYTGGEAPDLVTVDLAAPSGPRVVDTKRKVPAGRLLAFSIPENGSFLAIATERGYAIYSLENPGYPLRKAFVDWPKGIDPGAVVDVALSPSGKELVVLQQPATLKAVDIQTWDIPIPAWDLGTAVDDPKLPMARTVQMLHHAGSTILWVGLGDTPQSLRVGYHPGSVVIYSYNDPPDRTKPPVIQKIGSYPLPDRSTPSLMVPVTRGLDEAEDARLSKGSFFLYVGLLHSELMSLGTNPLTTPSGLQQGAQTIASLKTLFSVLRFDEVGGTRALHQGRDVVGAMAFSHDGKRLLTVQCTPSADPARPDVSISCSYSYGQAKGHRSSHAEGGLPKERFGPALRFGTAAIQK